MTIMAIGASRNRPSSEMINAAVGREDQYGNSFEVIELERIHNDCGTYAKTRGFQDTYIQESGGKLQITYGHPGQGKITWLRPKFGSLRRGRIGKSPYNMTKLASTFYDNKYRIIDKVIRAEVEAMAKRREEEMSPEDRSWNQKRRKALHTRPDIGYVHGRDRKDFSALETEEKRLELHRQEKELKQRELEIAEREARLLKKRVQGISEGTAPVEYSELYLESVKSYSELKKIAKTVGVTAQNNVKRPELIEKIMQAQRTKPDDTGDILDDQDVLNDEEDIVTG